MGVSCWYHLESVLSRPEARQNDVIDVNNRHPAMINPGCNKIPKTLVINYRQSAYCMKIKIWIEINHSLLCHTTEWSWRQVSPHLSWRLLHVRFRGTQSYQWVLTNYGAVIDWCRLPGGDVVLSRVCLEAGFLFPNSPFQRNWWVSHNHCIPELNKSIWFRWVRPVDEIGLCSSGSSLVIAMTWRTACANFICEVCDVNKQIPGDFDGIKKHFCRIWSTISVKTFNNILSPGIRSIENRVFYAPFSTLFRLLPQNADRSRQPVASNLACNSAEIMLTVFSNEYNGL